MLGAARSGSRPLSVSHVNVGGWLARDVSVAMRAIGGPQHDVLVFTETWLSPGQSAPTTAGYTALTFSRTQVAGRRRHCGGQLGGIAMYVRSSMTDQCEEWYRCPHGDFAIVRIRGVLASGGDVMLVACYIPPGGSRFYRRSVWNELEEQVGRASAVGEVLMMGDFNARTSTRPDFPADAHSRFTTAIGAVRPLNTERASADSRGRVNTSGLKMLEMCQRTGVRIANGRVHGDEDGAYTFVSHSGKSVIDYVLASAPMMTMIECLEISPAAETDHLVVSVTLRGSAPFTPHTPIRAPLEPKMRNPRKIEEWVASLSQPANRATCTRILGAATAVSDEASLRSACSQFDGFIRDTWATIDHRPRMRRRRLHGQSAPWFTPRLARMRQEANRAMRREPTSSTSVNLRRTYQQALRRARRAHLRERCITLAGNLRHEPRKFWDTYHAKGARPEPPIPTDLLTQHFSALYAAPQAAPPQATSPRYVDTDTTLLDAHFTVEEVTAGIVRLRRCKATLGLLSLEGLAAASIPLAKPIAALFNACVRVGTMPEEWALCRITAIHKGGDTMEAGNYRGIAVGTVLAKLYATILNTRLMNWAETQHLRAHGQAGFRPEHGTLDHMLVLRTLIESARAENESRYVCFVDFRKAYDTVPRDLLWLKLRALGVTGWCLNAIQTLYSHVPLLMRGSPAGQAPFGSYIGVKQGCPLSPFLFGVYIDDLESTFSRATADLDPATMAGRTVPPLLYADDLTLVARSQSGLQAQMDLLSSYCLEWRLTVNVAKTRAVVFRPPRAAATPLHLIFEGHEVEVQDSFCFLGVTFHSTQPFSSADGPRVSAGHRAAMAMGQRCRELGLRSPLMRMRLFDILIRPVMLYGVEVWGPHSLGLSDPHFEREHRQLLRQLLGVRTSTPSTVVLAELGRYPLSVLATRQLCRFWNRLVAMDDDRLVYGAFRESVRLATSHNASRSTLRAPWAAQVADLLDTSPIENGEPVVIDIKSTTEALQAKFLATISHSDRPKVHDYIARVSPPTTTADYRAAEYVRQVDRRAQLKHLAQLRTGSHHLRIETGRWERPRISRDERLCLRCDSDSVDDEHHMVFECLALEHIRQRFPDLFGGPTTLSSFLRQDSRQVASYVSTCFETLAEMAETTSDNSTELA